MVMLVARDDVSCGLGIEVERDRDDLEALRIQLRAQRLPPGQVKPAASPRGPGGEENLSSAHGTQRERVALLVRKREVRRDGGRQRTPAAFRAERPEVVLRVVNDGHVHALRDNGDIDRIERETGERDAAVAAARTLGLDRPPGRRLELRCAHAE
jgi:hypothetical protein